MAKYRILDLCCGAGGTAMGLYQAGFAVTGLDIEPQPNYPFRFRKFDVTELDPDWIAENFHAINAAPPCQAWSTLGRQNKLGYPELIKPIRDICIESGLPYVVENVPGAPLIDPVALCGSAFGLRVRRHRCFESSFPIDEVGCFHNWQNGNQPYRIIMTKTRKTTGFRKSGIVPVYGGNHILGGNSLYYKSVAMGIDWMDEGEINEAIPPAYGRHVGRCLLRYLQGDLP